MRVRLESILQPPPSSLVEDLLRVLEDSVHVCTNVNVCASRCWCIESLDDSDELNVV